MTDLLPSLREDVKRAKERLMQMILKDPDNELALVMYEADVFRAKRELERVEKKAEVRWPLMEEKRAA